MQASYSGLCELMEQVPEARRYYNSLPGYVRQMMTQREQNINSFESLRHYADNLTKGDG